MKKNRFGPIRLASVLLILVSLACSSLQAAPPTPTAVPTSTSTPLPTATVLPTATLLPTETPDVAATQEYNDFYSQVQDYFNKGYIPSTNGSYYKLDDFSQEWAQINWFHWWTVDLDHTVTDFVINAHFKWSTASPTPEDSGCGFVFALQDSRSYNKDQSDNEFSAVFLDKSRIAFYHHKVGQYSYEVGKTKGTGRVDIESEPADADFSLAVSDHTAYVYVNKELIGQYTLAEDSPMEGQLAYSMLSGTNKDYGTKCDMTNVQLWQLK
jgi:hypothetical protein